MIDTVVRIVASGEASLREHIRVQVGCTRGRAGLPPSRKEGIEGEGTSANRFTTNTFRMPLFLHSRPILLSSKHASSLCYAVDVSLCATHPHATLKSSSPAWGALAVLCQSACSSRHQRAPAPRLRGIAQASASTREGRAANVRRPGGAPGWRRPSSPSLERFVVVGACRHERERRET